MTPEELALIESGNVLPEVEEELEETLDDLGQIHEQISLHVIESEERHEQILEAIEVNHQCLLRLEASSTESQNPVSQALLTEVTTLKSEIAELRGMLTAIQATLTAMPHSTRRQQPNESTQESPRLESENPSEQSQERSTEEPRPEETPVMKHKHRIV